MSSPATRAPEGTTSTFTAWNALEELPALPLHPLPGCMAEKVPLHLQDKKLFVSPVIGDAGRLLRRRGVNQRAMLTPVAACHISRIGDTNLGNDRTYDQIAF